MNGLFQGRISGDAGAIIRKYSLLFFRRQHGGAISSYKSIDTGTN